MLREARNLWQYSIWWDFLITKNVLTHNWATKQNFFLLKQINKSLFDTHSNTFCIFVRANRTIYPAVFVYIKQQTHFNQFFFVLNCFNENQILITLWQNKICFCSSCCSPCGIFHRSFYHTINFKYTYVCFVIETKWFICCIWVV